jgi:hypothetical protein
MWSNTQSINRWKSLLNSPDRANRRVALTLAQAHAMPETLRDAVLIEKLTHPDRKQVHIGMELAIALGEQFAMEALYFRFLVIGTAGTSYGWVKAFLKEKEQFRATKVFKSLGYGMEYETAVMLTQLEALDPEVSTERIAAWLCAAEGIRRPIRYLAFRYLADKGDTKWIHYTLPYFVEDGRLSLAYLAEFPEAILGLENLRAVHCMGGSKQLLFFPEKLINIPSLEAIHLPVNRIEHIPENICEMARLAVLDLSYNPLKTIPDCMAAMQSLKKITVTLPLISEEARTVLHKIQLAQPGVEVIDNAK